jgi:dihydroorotate dehydrogenase electron transfer subunit
MIAVTPSTARQMTAVVRENILVARETYRLRLDAPELARSIRPGQFLMVRAGNANDPLLGRPFALYDVVRDDSNAPVAVDVVYLVIGRGTTALASCRPGDSLPIWGPLGNGFEPVAEPPGAVVFVAGGIGQTPFLALGRWWLGKSEYDGVLSRPMTSATLLYGVRNAAFAAGIDDFRAADIAVELATDDGSGGHHGFVTDLLIRRLEHGERPARVVGCGPPAMLAALAKIAARYELPCEVSLENHMACGFGACFSCVAPIRQDDGTTDLRRVCVEGPVFRAERVVWSH